MGERVRLGVIGCGNVMPHYMAVAERLKGRGLVEVTAACDRDAAKGPLMREKHGVRRFTTEPREVIESPDVDLVLVLTPMQEHAPLAAAALRAGKHVLVEKMLATTLSEAAELVTLARKGPGRLLCAPHVVLSPTYRTIRERIRGGAIGKVLSARARYGSAEPYWQGGWVYRHGAGALFEFGVYNVTSLTGLLGPARRVAALAGSTEAERSIGGERVKAEAEDNAQVLIDFGEGVLAAVTTGFTLRRYRSPAIEMYGSAGTLQMLGDDWAPRGYELWENSAGSWKHYEETEPDWPWANGLRHLVENIHAGTRPAIAPEHAYHVLEVLIRAQESAKDGVARAIESVFEPLSLDGGAGP